MPVEIDQHTARIHRPAPRCSNGNSRCRRRGRWSCRFVTRSTANRFYTPIDEKPKSVAAGDLKRVRNIKANSRVALVIDHYSEDWRELSYVLVSGEAEIIEPEAGDSEHARAVTLLARKVSAVSLDGNRSKTDHQDHASTIQVLDARRVSILRAATIRRCKFSL